MTELDVNKLLSSFEECEKYYKSLPFGAKYRFNAPNHCMRWTSSPYRITTDGFVAKMDQGAVSGSGGNYYVYVWMHLLTGIVFYVGSGAGERWTTKNRGDRCGFFKQLDEGDSIVYKVLIDVDEETARFYERYISISLSKEGFELVNKDNIHRKETKRKVEQWLIENADRISNSMTKDIEDFMINHMVKNAFTLKNVLDSYKFREEYGNNYFSSRRQAVCPLMENNISSLSDS